MVLLEAFLVVALFGVLVYGLVLLLTRDQAPRPPAALPGRWRVAHYDSGGRTRVVLQKLSDSGATLLDEHLVAAIEIDDPEYDEKFLTAMSTARERRALFESETEP